MPWEKPQGQTGGRIPYPNRMGRNPGSTVATSRRGQAQQRLNRREATGVLFLSLED